MALHLSVLLLFTGVTGIHSIIQTVSKVSVKAGRSISVPCLYESQHTHHVKYLCRGSKVKSCSTEVKTNQRNSSGKFSISDDKHQRIFTVTFNNPSVDDTHYWCAVEMNDGPDHAVRFQLSVTRGSPQLSVDHQEITGFNGDDVNIHFKYSISGEIQWCRLGGSCVKETSGSLDGTRVTINVNVTDFTVTLSGLRTESSGWYLCTKGDLQMPVHVTVKERPSTTTSEPVNHTAVSAYEENHSVSIHLKSFIIRLSLLIFIVMVALFIWFMFKRHMSRVIHLRIPPPFWLFCRMEELDEINAVWNSHRIRPTRNHNVPSGIPEVMHTAPQLWGSEDFIVPHNDLDDCRQTCKFLSAVSCNEDIFDLSNMIMSESGLTFPKNISQVQEFYWTIQEALHSHL